MGGLGLLVSPAAGPPAGVAKVDGVVRVRLQALATIVAIRTKPKVTMRIVVAPYS